MAGFFITTLAPNLANTVYSSFEKQGLVLLIYGIETTYTGIDSYIATESIENTKTRHPMVAWFPRSRTQPFFSPFLTTQSKCTTNFSSHENSFRSECKKTIHNILVFQSIPNAIGSFRPTQGQSHTRASALTQNVHSFHFIFTAKRFRGH